MAIQFCFNPPVQAPYCSKVFGKRWLLTYGKGEWLRCLLCRLWFWKLSCRLKLLVEKIHNGLWHHPAISGTLNQGHKILQYPEAQAWNFLFPGVFSEYFIECCLYLRAVWHAKAGSYGCSYCHSNFPRSGTVGMFYRFCVLKRC